MTSDPPTYLPSSQPVLSCNTLTTSGWLIRSRQLAAPPLTQPLDLGVGRYHSVRVHQEVKGSRQVAHEIQGVERLLLC